MVYSKKITSAISIALAATLLASSCVIADTNAEKKWSTEKLYNSIRLVKNTDGVTLGYSTKSGVTIIEKDGYAFKDLNKNGKLDIYEDWREDIQKRAQDLASQMTVEQIAGLMLYSAHQSIPSASEGFGAGTYDGKPYKEGEINPASLSDAQIDFITNDNLRHVLVTTVKDTKTAANWNNNAQELAESLTLGIPINTSSDPRHGSDNTKEFNAGAGGSVSMWPSSLGIAATFNPAVMRQFGEIASNEYRALGIATALSPQVDLSTDPRWSRVSGTTGESPELSTDMAKAYVDGFQTSKGDKIIKSGWGYESVNAMVKHWPGGGTGEAGRDAHYGFGKFAVYPGENLKTHLKPFIDGAFNLAGGTKKASAVMPYYTISWNQNPDGENVGNSYSKWIVTDLLREKYNYDGVVCTDWGITSDEVDITDFASSGKCWGVENLTIPERFLMLLEAGVDQFGGVNKSDGILGGYELLCEKIGKEKADERMQQSAVRLLKNIFQVGLFENPYLNIEESEKIVGNSEYMQAGYNAQLESIVMLKNKKDVLPLRAEDDKKLTIYVPDKIIPETTDFFGNVTPAGVEDGTNLEVLKKYYNVTKEPEKADAAIVFVNNPDPGKGYLKSDAQSGGNGYLPMTLQYGEYTAEYAKEESIAGDSRTNDVLNRTYKGKTVTASNTKDLDTILETREKMGSKPVIVCVNMSNPMVFNEFENKVDAILVGFEIQSQAFIDIISGKNEPKGLLPMQMPANMKTVELQYEDVPFDMECHVDSEGNSYDFAFGMNWKGVINDERVNKYKVN